MEQWFTMMSALLPVFGVMTVGVAVRRLNWLTEQADRTMVNLCVRLLLPCFIIVQMNRSEWPASAGGLIFPAVVGFTLTAMGFAVCGLFIKPFAKRIGLTTPQQIRSFVLCAGMFNYGYIPIPLVQQLFPRGAELPALLLHNVGVEIAMWTLGLLILSGKMGKRWWIGILNPVVIALAIAIILRLTGGWATIARDAKPVITILDMIGQCAIPLSLLLSGATIADVWRDSNFRHGWGVISAGVVLRLGLLPVLFILFATLIPFDPSLKRVIVIQSAMPAAVFPIILCRHYNGDAATAVRIVLSTHLLCLITAPLWLMVGL